MNRVDWTAGASAMLARKTRTVEAARFLFDVAFDGDRWARVRMVARVIPDDADLDDDADVVRALFAARLCGADFSDVLDEAIDEARETRETRRAAR